MAEQDNDAVYFYLIASILVCVGGLTLLEFWLPLKKDVLFFETPSRCSQYGYCKSSNTHRDETYANISVDLLDGGHCSKAAALMLWWLLYLTSQIYC